MAIKDSVSHNPMVACWRMFTSHLILSHRHFGWGRPQIRQVTPCCSCGFPFPILALLGHTPAKSGTGRIPETEGTLGCPVSGAPTSQGLWILPDYSGRVGLVDRAVLLHVVLSLFPRPIGWASFLIPKGCKAAASFLLLERSLPARSNPFCWRFHIPFLLFLLSDVVCVSPRKSRGPAWSHSGKGLWKCPLSAWVWIARGFLVSFVVYFGLGSLLPTSGHSKAVKRERLAFRPSVALITNCFGGRLLWGRHYWTKIVWIIALTFSSSYSLLNLVCPVIAKTRWEENILARAWCGWTETQHEIVPHTHEPHSHVSRECTGT